MSIDHDATLLADEIKRIRRTMRVILIFAWGVAIVIMIYGVPIVYRLLVDTDVPKETAWLLSLAVDGALAVGLIATPVLANYGIKAGWVGALRWVAGIATWALNTAGSWLKGDGVSVFTHSIGPLMMFVAVEAAAAFQRKMSAKIAEKQAEARRVDTTRKTEAARRAEEIRKARAEAEEQTRKRAEAEAALQAEERKRQDAEERAEAEAAGRKKAEEQAAAGAEEWAEEARKMSAEIQRLTGQGDDTAGRYRQALDEAKASARDARTEAAQQSEMAAKTAGQLDEAREIAERAVAGRLLAEQQVAALTEAHAAVADELERVRQANVRLQQRAEAAGRKESEVSASSGRKRTPVLPGAVPVSLPGDVPPVEGASAEVVARVLSAYRANPGGTRQELATAAGVSDRTVRTVLNGLPANHPLLAVTGDQKTNGHAVEVHRA